MGLKITKAHEIIEVKTLTTCIYAQPGVGRTTLGFSARKPLLLDFDGAVHRAKNRGDAVRIDRWSEVDKMEQADLAGYETIVVDTVGRLLDVMSIAIMDESPKNGTGAGGLSLKGYGVMKASFTAWLGRVRSWGLNVVLLAHMEETKDGDSVRERLDIVGASKNEVYKVSDQMGRIYMEGGERMLNFSPSDVAFGKNPGQFDPLVVPHYTKQGEFLGGLIDAALEKINEMTAAQVEVVKLTQEWEGIISALETAEDFNERLPGAKESDERVRPVVKRMLLDAATAKGLAFDKAKGVFLAPPPQEKPKRGKASTPEASEREPGAEG